MPSMKEYALQYQKLGFSVIPINPKNKMPLIEFADKPAMTASEIERFWDGYPNANIALRTTNFFVIDIDKHGKENGFESLKKWEHLNLIEPTLQAKTASGGKHLLYFKRDDEPITQMIKFLPGVDIKAHENNYIIVAPSATENGQYEWDLEKSAEGGTIVTPSRDLIRAIKKQYGKTHGYRYDGKDGLRDLARRSQTRDRTQTTDLFETIALGFGDEGGRNDKLAKFVGGLLYRAVDDGVVVQLARLANANSPKPLPEKEMMRTIESMIKKDRR
ncbi:replication protein [Streptococcus pneumoniae]|nr:replication protein [Streptococcus pneumoniae]CRC23853.1 replication protein [Streptococcus pneumoniae]VIU35414.1 replication protein [Streptococcus pneumoniae]VJJ22074.1 replication protein [Streptococcus pneumoniae]VJR07995.1 replication protein [Streptococcus pneumoniae]